MAYSALQFPVTQPAMRNITAITNATNALVTTSFAHQYIPGIIVRLYIPQSCGMPQANQQTATILTVPSTTTFTIDLNTTTYQPFSIPGSPNPHIQVSPQVVPIGEVNETLKAAFQNVLPYS